MIAAGSVAALLDDPTVYLPHPSTPHLTTNAESYTTPRDSILPSRTIASTPMKPSDD